jgi:hypothetical protein
MKVTVKIWDPDNQGEEDAKSVEFDDWGDPLNSNHIQLRRAAEFFMEKRWANNDYITPMYANVRTPEGVLIRFEVYAQDTVSFHAIPLP